MDAGQFLRWAAEQDDARFELVHGEAVAMSPERARHVDTKMRAWALLTRAVGDAGLQCTVMGDGMAVVIDSRNTRQPDVSIQCSAIDPESVVLDNPIVVVEIVSPSSSRVDTGAKVADYARVESIRHYLIVDPYGGSVIRHSRAGDAGDFLTTVIRSGPVVLDPPGISVNAEALLGLHRVETPP